CRSRFGFQTIDLFKDIWREPACLVKVVHDASLTFFNSAFQAINRLGFKHGHESTQPSFHGLLAGANILRIIHQVENRDFFKVFKGDVKHRLHHERRSILPLIAQYHFGT
ncbi:hypothetical protein, partial [Pseudovibrio axinellae]|uniref:hypothetical protein n=1 Tax=Pseudovibrio axinellae TaxID=989403 RepID=UPI00193E6E93